MNSLAMSPAERAAMTYNAAADHFDEAALSFWDVHGRRAVELADLRCGQRVLDVGCGTGASALPAAQAVGPGGRVVGLDVAMQMLAVARHKAFMQNLENVEFRWADMGACGEAYESFDAIISVFSIFFVTDMEAQVAELWRMLRPGGRLVVTVWGERPFEPAGLVFYEELRHLRPDWSTRPPPWGRLTTAEGLRRLLVGGGAADPRIEPAPYRQPLADPSDWWTIVLGSGMRGDIAQLEPDEQELLRVRVVERLADGGVGEVEAHGLHAIACKPPSTPR